MKKYTWDKIIKENKKEIKLVWYGSLLNNNTHHSEHKWEPVIINWFKRVYNLRVIPLKPTKEWKEFFKTYLKKYWIVNKKTQNKYINKTSCVLNCIKTGNKNDIVNGLCINIPSADFKSYSIRESQYNLYKTKIENICPNTWKKTKNKEKAYVLVAKKSILLKKWRPFISYHNNTRNWAYNIWKYFWELFDKSTFNTKGKNIINS